MARTFLQLMQAACNELGIPEPSQIIGAADETSKQLLALANREGKEFSQMANGKGGWQNLHKEYTFDTEVLSLSGTTTSGSAVITGISDTTGIVASFWGASGTGIPSGARIASVDSSTQVTLDQPATASGTVTINFAQVAYALPSDFEYFAYRTFWDGAYKWELLGPINAQEKQILRYGIVASGPRRKFYVRLNKIWLDPLPETDAQTIAFDYYSNAWCTDTNGADQTIWTADTDLYKLDDECFIEGIKWRFLRSKGLEYTQEKMDYDSDCQRVMARDGGNRALPLSGGTYGARFLNYDNIPETGYGQ